MMKEKQLTIYDIFKQIEEEIEKSKKKVNIR